MQYSFVAGETLNSLAVNCGLVGEITNYAAAIGDGFTTSLRLYQIDNTASDNVGRLVSTLNLKNEKIHYEAKTKLVVQNRTKGATGSSDNLDVIDAQPLKGRIYYFKKGNPIVREMASLSPPPNTETLLSRWSESTVKLCSDISAGYDSALKNPPSPFFFQNCSKSAVISLEPGDLKEYNLYNYHEKYYEQFIRSLAWYSGAGLRRQKVGDTVYIAMEERLNSGSSNPITLQYEAELDINCYLTTNRVSPMVKTFAITNVST